MKPFLVVLLLLVSGLARAQKDSGPDRPGIDSGTLSALKFRCIGPALMSGRVADLAVDPVQPNTWYVAAGSGNLWKTTNAGTTWSPIFERYGSYSIGCVTIDPNDHHTLWVGTGEAVGGRHVGIGDGVEPRPCSDQLRSTPRVVARPRPARARRGAGRPHAVRSCKALGGVGGGHGSNSREAYHKYAWYDAGYPADWVKPKKRKKHKFN